MKKIFFWQNVLSMHQSALIRNIADYSEHEVVLVAASKISSYRIDMGWSFPDFGSTTVIVAPEDDVVDALIYSDFEDCQRIHIFSGIRGYPFVKKAFKKCLKTTDLTGLYSEAIETHGFKGVIKKLIHRYDAFRFKRKIDFILAIGERGKNWYEFCGYPLNKVFQFGYFVETPDNKSNFINNINRINEELQIIFIGSLIVRKGLDILIKAFSHLTSYRWKLKIVGDGPERSNLEALIVQLNLSQRIDFVGSLNNADAMDVLENADFMVLPSRHDGWGAVVNESLLRGIPVLCSDMCGACVLLDGMERGEIFHACSIESLLQVLEKWIQKGHLDDYRKEKIKKWAIMNASGKAGAEYLHCILRYVDSGGARPVIPWTL